jgi:acyl dehydratase
MPIDPAIALGTEPAEIEFSWTESDVLLYHLAVGAGSNPDDPRELSYLLEDRLRVLPTFGVVAPNFRTFEPPAVRLPGIELDLTGVLHGGQLIMMHQPVAPAGTALARQRVVELQDKGTAAVVVVEAVITHRDGSALWTSRSSIFARGEGGFGGSRGTTERVAIPGRAPDQVVDIPTLPQQAQLYRLCGDRNPLHTNPDFARTAGFDRPILHGLCTWGMVCKSIVDIFLDSNTDRILSYSGKFAGVVFPGETLRVRIWSVADELMFTVSVPARDALVLSDGLLVARPG